MAAAVALEMASRKYSGYYEELENEAKARCYEKLNRIGKEADDSYTLELQGISESTQMPDIQYPDVYNYLINKTSSYTSDELQEQMVLPRLSNEKIVA